MRFALRRVFVKDTDQQDVNEDLLLAVNAVARYIDGGNGAPTHTPEGPALYFRHNGGAGTSIYKYQPGTGWSAL